MSEYDPPREIVPIFNPVDWLPFGTEALTVAEGDGRYLKLTGGTERGPVTFNQDITLKDDIEFVSGVNTATIGMDGLGQLEITGTQALSITSNGINMNGETLDMTNGEIHKVPLIHGPNNVDMVVESRGTGDLILKTNGVNRVVVADNGNITMDTNVLFVDGVNNRVGVGTTTPSKTFTVVGETNLTGPIYISDMELRLRTPDDGNHFVAYRQTFGGVSIDGPMMVGFLSGALGVKSGGDKVIARYDSTSFTILGTATLNADTIRGRTSANTATLCGISISNSVIPSANLGTNQLGFTTITSNFTSVNPVGNVAITGFSVSITVPTTTRRVKVSAWARNMFNSVNSNYFQWQIWQGNVGTGTQVAAGHYGGTGSTNMGFSPFAQAILTLAAGSYAFNVGWMVNTNTGTLILEAGATYPACILAELL